MAKFAVYEVAFEKICTAAGKKPTELTEGTKTAFNLSAGLIAGLAAAFISQPADTLLSRMNKTAGRPGQGMVSRIMEVRLHALLPFVNRWLIVHSTSSSAALVAARCQGSLRWHGCPFRRAYLSHVLL